MKKKKQIHPQNITTSKKEDVNAKKLMPRCIQKKQQYQKDEQKEISKDQGQQQQQ